MASIDGAFMDKLFAQAYRLDAHREGTHATGVGYYKGQPFVVVVGVGNGAEVLAQALDANSVNDPRSEDDRTLVARLADVRAMLKSGEKSA